MKCEICHKGEAEVAIHKIEDGAERELYVCHACAAAENAKTEKRRGEDMEDGPPKGLPEAAKLITGLLKQMIDAGMETASVIENPTARHSGPPCPVCGMTADDYHRTSRLGCAHCYEHFATPLAPVIRDMQPGATHVGKVPQPAACGAGKGGK